MAICPRRRLRIPARPVLGLALVGLLVGTAALGRSSASAESELRELDLVVGGELLLRVGVVDRLLDLDPEVARASVQAPDTVRLEGLSYGLATVRVETSAGVVVLRVAVHPSLPADSTAGGNTPDMPSRFELDGDFRFFGYHRSGVAGETEELLAHSLRARRSFGATRASAEVWLEDRPEGSRLPHYRVELDRTVGRRNLSVQLGFDEARWGRYLFEYERFEGMSGSLELEAAGIGIDLFAGRDAPDLVRLGQREGLGLALDDRLLGARVRWRDGQKLAAEAGFGYRRSDFGETAVALLAARGRTGAIAFDARAATDGSGLAGAAVVTLQRPATTLTLNLDHADHRFGSVNQQLELIGHSVAGAQLSRGVGRRLRLQANSAWREIAVPVLGVAQEERCPHGLVPRDDGSCEVPFEQGWTHGLSAELDLGGSNTLAARLGQRDEGTREGRLRRREASVLLRFGEHTVAGSTRLAFSSSLENIEVEPLGGGIFPGRLGWQSVVVEPLLALGAPLRIDGRIERRLAHTVPDGVTGLAPWLLAARASWSAGQWGLLGRARLRLSYREWESVTGLQARVLSGRYASAGLELRSRPLGPLELTAVAGWTRELERGRDDARFELGARYRLAGPGRTVNRGVVHGVVYHDLNGDGVRQAGEPGLPGVGIELGDGSAHRTDREGRYRLKVAGPTSLRLVAGGIGSGLDPTTSPFASVSPQPQRRRLEVDFGLGPAPVIVELVVWNDLDGDGEWDTEREPLVPGVELEALGATRELIASAASERRRTVELALPVLAVASLDWRSASVPAGYRGATATAVALVAGSGERQQALLPLAALRSVAGVVFRDEDGDGVRDLGEPPVTGVVVAAGARRAVSDRGGRYSLRGLPAGPIEIFIESAPAGVLLPPRSADRQLVLPSEPVAREGIDLALAVAASP